MKDIVISARRIRREALFAAAALLIAYAANIYAVVHFDRPWYELYTRLNSSH